MHSGYIWPVSYTRSNKSGKCETLKMEVQFAVYSTSRNLLFYFSEVDTTSICKTIVGVGKWLALRLELYSL